MKLVYLTLILLILAVFVAVAACQPLTPAQHVTDLTFMPAAQRTIFMIQAASTLSAGASTQQAISIQIANTAFAATQQAGATATSQVISSTVQAAAAHASTQTVAAALVQQATGTARAEVQATQTVSVQMTKTALEMDSLASATARDNAAKTFLYVCAVIGLALAIVRINHAAKVRTNRGMVVEYGKNGLPFVITPEGAVWNPATNTWVGTRISKKEQAKLMDGYQKLLLANITVPQPEPQATRETVKIGPVERTTETGPALSRPAPSKQLDAPSQATPAQTDDDGLHPMFMQGSGMKEKDRDLLDLREMIERGSVIGFSRESWLDKPLASGHLCRRKRYDKMIEILTKVGVLQADGNTKKMVLSVDNALAACNLEGVDFA
jgi:hypothetical protein